MMKKIIITEQQLNKILIEENSNQNCDCCKYFDFKSLEKYVGLENPVYFLLAKGEINQLVFMTPDEYINIISKEAKSTPNEMLKYVDHTNISKYAEAMQNGAKFPIGYYSLNASISQEGRHRALAAKSIGCIKIPVVKIDKTIDYNYKQNFVRNRKNYSREDLENEFISKGYNGITDLDWQEFKNYVKYILD